MSVEKFSVSFEPDLGRQVREFADAEDQTVSAFLAEAARERVRQLVLHRLVDDYVAESGIPRAQLVAEGSQLLDQAAWSDASQAVGQQVA